MKKVNNNLNYSGAALSTDGVLYIGTQSNNKIFGLNTAMEVLFMKNLWVNR